MDLVANPVRQKSGNVVSNFVPNSRREERATTPDCPYDPRPAQKTYKLYWWMIGAKLAVGRGLQPRPAKKNHKF
jgi:hypothetical protein